jgi:hypothetical protein
MLYSNLTVARLNISEVFRSFGHLLQHKSQIVCVIHVSCANDSETVILKQTAVIGKDFKRNACSKNIIACLLIAILCEGFFTAL